jgi:NADH:ubiquinone oxidoreductase subunit 4 (subunit M)
MSWLLIGLFLPLFPLGMVFNVLFQRVRNAWWRALLLIIWPLTGLGLEHMAPVKVTGELIGWALFTAVLYGFRAVVVREVAVWCGFMATSAWSLVWIALAYAAQPVALVMYVLAFSLPLVLLVFLVSVLERRYESAYAGIICGIARAQPRLSGVIVITLLAAIGSPLFPGFFVLLNSITHAAASYPLAAFGIAVVWLLWSWSGIRLLQELTVGERMTARHDDISRAVTLGYGVSLLALAMSGLFVVGVML